MTLYTHCTQVPDKNTVLDLQHVYHTPNFVISVYPYRLYGQKGTIGFLGWKNIRYRKIYVLLVP